MRQLVLPIVVLAAACGDDLPCDPASSACTLDHAVSTVTVPAGTEDEDTCQSWTLDNPTELWVHSVTQHNDGAYHHANWFFVPDDQFALPDGAWPCSANSFDELVAALAGGFLFALSTQSTEETQTLPSAAGIRIPPYSRIIGSSHFLNATDAPITTTMRLTLDTLPRSQVNAKLAPARIQYHDLHLDPQARSSFTTECQLDTEYAKWADGPLHYTLYFALVHYHSLGLYQQLEIAGGPRDGEVIMRHDGYGDNAGHAIDPPLDLAAAGARGLRLTCGYENPRASEVRWGIGDQEMCVMALQAATEIGWDGDVAEGTGAKIGVGPDGEVQYQGACGVNSFPWDFTKEGGQGH